MHEASIRMKIPNNKKSQQAFPNLTDLNNFNDFKQTNKPNREVLQFHFQQKWEFVHMERQAN